jgi:hypothetical protein
MRGVNWFAAGGVFVGGAVNVGLALMFAAISFLGPRMNLGMLIAAGVMAPVGLLMFAVAGWLVMRGRAAQRIYDMGVPGQAQIVAMAQTNMMVNRQPVVELQLQVTTPQHGTYAVTKREVVPLIMLGRLTQGQPLAVKVDPGNPQNLVIVW